MQTIIDPFQVRNDIIGELQSCLPNSKYLQDCNVLPNINCKYHYRDGDTSNLIVKTFRVAYFPIKDPSEGSEKMVAQVYLSFTLHTTADNMHHAENQLVCLMETLVNLDIGYEGVRLNISDVPLHWRAVKGSETHIEKIADSKGLSKVNVISMDASCQIPM